MRLTGHCSMPSEDKTSMEAADKQLVIALAGNANVGKSVIFNHLTGSRQIIGNWPGKTVELAKGYLRFENYDIEVIDLPGIYSFSTFSLEEVVSREYIAFEEPNVVINVIDASVLERNLYFTLQLMELEVPLVICVNQMDIALKKGLIIDIDKLQAALGVPVIPTVAIRGEGLHDLMEVAVGVAKNAPQEKKPLIRYGAEVEERIEKLVKFLKSIKLQLGYPLRWIAIKLLEDDEEVREQMESESKEIIILANQLAIELEDIHQEPCFSIINSERYSCASRIANDSQINTEIEATLSEKLDRIVTHRVFGYVVSFMVIATLLLWTFLVGNFLSDILSQLFGFFQPVDPVVSGPVISILWNGAFGGIVAGITLVVPYIIPFYLMLTVIEDSGILPRVAFMMDSFMHKIGLHGKALVPLILGYGCNVPAIYTTRILETRRERMLAALAITFAPCSARTIIILGLVAAFVSIEWALALYLIDIFIMFIVGRMAFKALSGETTGLIMEIHTLRVPSFSVVTKQTWTRTKSIIYMVFPLYILGSALVQGMYAFGFLDPISNFLAPLTVWWLGLPAIAGILLIFGVIRKEYILLLLVAIYGTNLALVLTPVQFIVLALIGMLYIPCISTLAILIKEFGWRPTIAIALANLITAIIVGGIVYRLLEFLIQSLIMI